jgi:hypothetical protein
VTDEEMFTALFRRFNIDPKWVRRDLSSRHDPATDWAVRYTVTKGDTEKVGGYSGFMVDWYFNAEGEFVGMAIGE